MSGRRIVAFTLSVALHASLAVAYVTAREDTGLAPDPSDAISLASLPTIVVETVRELPQPPDAALTDEAVAPSGERSEDMSDQTAEAPTIAKDQPDLLAIESSEPSVVRAETEIPPAPPPAERVEMPRK